MAIKELTSKRKKTEKDLREIAQLEWFGGMYEMPNGKGKVPCIPGDNVHACVKNGGKAEKLGRQFDRYCFVIEEHCKLLYNGPKDIDKLWEDGGFMDQRSMAQGQVRILRTRPRFDSWALEFTLEFDDSQINPSSVERAVITGGMAHGLGDNRPRYGRFTVEVIE